MNDAIKMKNVKAIIKNDIRLVKKSKQIIIPMILIPLLFVIAIPIMMVYAPNIPGNGLRANELFIKNIPQALSSTLAGYTDSQKIAILLLKYFMAPLFSIIPLIAVNFIAADSIAGEKERKTIEAIKYAPISFKELFLGKTISIMYITMAISTVSFIVYCIVADVIAMAKVGEIILPDLSWLLLCFYLTPLLGFFGISIMIIVSAKAKGYREAQQLGGLIVLPPIIITVVQSMGITFLGVKFILLLGIAILVIDIFIYKLGVKALERSLYS